MRKNDRRSFTPLFSVRLILRTWTHWRHAELPAESLRWRQWENEREKKKPLPPPLAVIINRRWLRLKFPFLSDSPRAHAEGSAPLCAAAATETGTPGELVLCGRVVREVEKRLNIIQEKKKKKLPQGERIKGRNQYHVIAGFLGCSFSHVRPEVKSTRVTFYRCYVSMLTSDLSLWSQKCSGAHRGQQQTID